MHERPHISHIMNFILQDKNEFTITQFLKTLTYMVFKKLDGVLMCISSFFFDFYDEFSMISQDSVIPHPGKFLLLLCQS